MVEGFLEGQILAPRFKTMFIETRRKYINLALGKGFEDIYSEIFLDVDEYTDLPDPDPVFDIDEAELRRRCAINLEKLKQLVK